MLTLVQFLEELEHTQSITLSKRGSRASGRQVRPNRAQYRRDEPGEGLGGDSNRQYRRSGAGAR